jgi:hypothetical protein
MHPRSKGGNVGARGAIIIVKGGFLRKIGFMSNY